MSDKISRRTLVRGAVGAAAVSALSPIQAATQQPAEDPDLDRRLDRAEKMLSKPLSPEAKKIAREMLKGVDNLTESRMKQRLPENSEPCTVYVPTTAMKPGTGGRS